MAETSKTVDHALRLLVLLGENGPSSSAELARAAGLNRTVVHRLLTTMRQRGFVARTEAGYIPGAVLVRMAEQVRPELRAAAHPILVRLAAQTGETIVLAVADGGNAVVLDQVVEAGHLVRVRHEVGSRHPLEGGATGRALLANLDADSVKRVVDGHPDRDRLRTQLEQVGRDGYALSHDELQDGVRAVAVPVFGADQFAVASLAILSPVSRQIELTGYVPDLITAAAQIASELRYTSGQDEYVPAARRPG